ncbi:MAG: hypothetical protein U0Z26_13570 [Anaerolineales bacterium]
MTLIALISSIIISMGTLFWGFEEAGLISVSRWLIVFAVFWLVSLWQNWRWVSSVGLFISVFAAAFGLWVGFNPGWMIASGIFALFAWDLTEFHHRLHFLPKDSQTYGMERRHIARLSLLTFAGLALASFALRLQFKFTFEWGVFLVLVILLGLAQLVAWFRRETK